MKTRYKDAKGAVYEVLSSSEGIEQPNWLNHYSTALPAIVVDKQPHNDHVSIGSKLFVIPEFMYPAPFIG
jgi:hypothetical protein